MSLLWILYVCFAVKVIADVPWHTNLTAYQAGELGEQPRQHFHSAPHISAPIYQVNAFNYEKADPAPYIFLTSNSSGHGDGPSIISARDLSLIWAEEWYSTSHSAQPFVFKSQWVLAAYANAQVILWNPYYEQIYHVPAQIAPGELEEDNHECFPTDDETVIIIACRKVEADLESVGGAKEGDCIRNCYFQEIDPVNRRVLFEFDTLSIFGLEDSIWPYKGEGVFFMVTACHDFCHMNSVQKVKT